jgi:hypothetical protein
MGASKRTVDKHTIYAAVVLAFGMFAYWWMFYRAGYSSGRHEERAHIEREHYAAEAADQLSKVCGQLSGTAAAKCAYDTAETEREYRRNESDLAAQWKAADWVLWGAVIAGAQLVATAAGLFFIKRTLDASWQAVATAQATTRAYIAIERPRLVPGVKTSYVTDGIIVIQIAAENIGKSTAHVHSIYWGCSRTNAWPPPAFISEMLPRGSAIHGEQAGDVGNVQATWNGEHYPYVLGIVGYRSAFNAEHHAHFCFQVEPITPEDGFQGPTVNASSFFKGGKWPEDT